MAGIVGEQGINADDMLSGKMIVNDAVVEREQQAVSAFAAFHPLLVAETNFPFIATGRAVAGSRAILVDPAYRISIAAATEQPPEQGNLFFSAQVQN